MGMKHCVGQMDTVSQTEKSSDRVKNARHLSRKRPCGSRAGKNGMVFHASMQSIWSLKPKEGKRGTVLLFFQQKTHSGRITAPCSYGMERGNNVLAVGHSFRGRLLPCGRPQYLAEPEHVSESSNQLYQTISRTSIVKASYI